MELTLWEHVNYDAPQLNNWQMMERQDPVLRPGLCLQAKGADTRGKILYSVEGRTFMHGGLPRFSAFIYEAQKKVFFPYFQSEPRMNQEIALDQKLDFKHAIPWSTPEPKVGEYDVLLFHLRESMENKVQEAYRFYILSEGVNSALHLELDRYGLAMVSSGGKISFPIIVEKGKEKSTSSDDTIAICTNFGDGTGKRIRKLEICQKRAEVQLREIYSSLQTRFGYKVEITP